QRDVDGRVRYLSILLLVRIPGSRCRRGVTSQYLPIVGEGAEYLPCVQLGVVVVSSPLHSHVVCNDISSELRNDFLQCLEAERTKLIREIAGSQCVRFSSAERPRCGLELLNKLLAVICRR